MRTGFVSIVAIMLAVSSGSAQPPGNPRLGVYFDEAGQDVGGYYSSPLSVVHFYLFARNLEQVGAARFLLEMDPQMFVCADSLSLPPSKVSGSPETGVRIDFDPVLVADDTGIVLLGEGDFFVFAYGLTLTVGVRPHPDDDDVLIDAADGAGWVPATGMTGWLTFRLPVEALRWGEVKALYR
ncbi:MAG: hypothetical protein C0395_08190 [Gemmatimonas sp.]|nr:hypothetical protein [Gemmatimonas sp.]